MEHMDINHPKIYDEDGNEIQCIQSDTIQRIFELWKQINTRLKPIEDFVQRKELQNGYTEKEVTDLKSFAEKMELMFDAKISELRDTQMKFIIAVFAILGIFMTAVLGIAAYAIFGVGA